MTATDTNRLFRLVSIGFAVLGIGLLVGGWLMYRRTTRFLDTATSTTGTVVANQRRIDSDGTTSYPPEVRFTAPAGDTIEFRSSGGSTSSMYSIGERVPVLYDPRNPGDAEIRSFTTLWLFPLILGARGVAFGAAGVAGWAYFSRAGRRDALQEGARARDEERLRTNGTRLMTDFQRVIEDTSWEMNGRHPYRIVTQWHDRERNEVRTFESDPLWFDPRAFVGNRSIAVHIDPADPERYYMDTSFLPKDAS